MMKKRCCIGMFLAVFVWVSSAAAFTDFSGELDFETIRERYKAGQMDREDYLLSSLKTAFKPQKTVSRAKSATVHKDRRDLTMLFKSIVLYYDEFSPEARDVVDKILLRPDSSNNTWPWDSTPYFYLTNPLVYEPLASEYPNIADKYKFWYQVDGGLDSGGHDHNTTSDLSFLYAVVAAFEEVYSKEISVMGYPAPPFDGAAADNGYGPTIDVYLMNCGEYGIYGYTAPEDIGDNDSYASYMVVDNDFIEFVTDSISAVDAMKVTVAHEFHHTIQFGININISDYDEWILEDTSTWMESQVYPDIKDNLQYLNASWGFFSMPEEPIDSYDQWYNAWIFLEYMSVLWETPDVVLDLWNVQYKTTNDAMTGLLQTIDAYGSDLSTVFTDFAVKNYTQSDFYPYPDYEDYNEVAIANGSGQTLDFSTDQSSTFDISNISLKHLAAKYYKFKPGLLEGEQGDTLTVQVEGTQGRPLAANVVVKNLDNSYTTSTITLDSANQGSVTIENFNQGAVTEAVLVLVNNSPTSLTSTFRISGELDVPGDGDGGCFIQGILPQ